MPHPKRFKFTEKAIAHLPKPVEKRATYHDSDVGELSLALQPSGAASYFWFRKVRGTPTWKTLGKVGEISLEQARDGARKLSGDLGSWKLSRYSTPSPFERARGEFTLGELHEHYVENHLEKNAKNPTRAAKDARWMLKRYLPSWKNRKVTAIRRPDIENLRDDLSEKYGPYSANRVIQLLKATLNHGLKRELWRGDNPAGMVDLKKETKRKRYLMPSEAKVFLQEVKHDQHPDFPDYVSLLLWTGARKSDVTSMRWSDVKLEDNRWDVPDPKNEEPYVVALTPEAVEILKKRLAKRGEGVAWVFPSHGATGHLMDMKKPWAALLKRTKIVGLRQHDLRRTLGSWQAALGASPQVIMSSLGHKTIQASMRYQQMDLDPVRKSVMNATRAILSHQNAEPAEAEKPARKQKPRTGLKPRRAKQLRGAVRG
jgi:integrase